MEYIYGLALLFALSCILLTTPIATLPAHPKDNGPNGRIIGGHQTDIAKYPYQVSVRLDSSVLIHICGGSIYAPRVIVTAAHCLKGRYASYIRVVAGSSTIADQTQQGVPAMKLIYHSDYNKKTKDNDVGLVILKEDLVYSALVQPIALATMQPAAGTHATITGWGKSDPAVERMTNLLQEAGVQIVDRAVCNENYMMKSYLITEQMVCAGVEAGGKDACQGDSGGPLMVDGKLLGIVSWGIGCAQAAYPGVYASVPYHSSWIEEQAAPYL